MDGHPADTGEASKERRALRSLRRHTIRRAATGAVAAIAVTLGVVLSAAPAQAASYVPIAGAGSTWVSNAIQQWASNVSQLNMTIQYQANGSSAGRSLFAAATTDFAVSEIPYGMTDQGVTEPLPSRAFAYLPLAAGGTSFMYHLYNGGGRVDNLRLTGDTIARIFTGVVTDWSDPLIAADNPGVMLPAEKIVPVVRSDGAGTTAQLTQWLSTRYPALWDAYCAKAGRGTPYGATSFYPVVNGSGFVTQNGSVGVSGYVSGSTAEGAITFVEYSYAQNARFPVAKVLNAAGYYVLPTAQNVGVALTAAAMNSDPASPNYLTEILDGVYTNPDPRAYPLSSYSYLIVPTALQAPFTSAKGQTLGDFGYYALCTGQQQAADLGYSPLPMNLVQAGLLQLHRIPGANVQAYNLNGCANPTFAADGTNTLLQNAPYPQACDQAGPTQCAGTTATSISLAANTSVITTAGVVTLSASVSPVTAVGTVGFYDSNGSTYVGAGTMVAGVATLPVTALSAGAHTFVASFLGSSGYGWSQSSPVNVVVNDVGSSPSGETITVTIPTGTLTISASAVPVDLGVAALDPAATLFVAGPVPMAPVTVTDTRAGAPGWNVTGQVGDFVGTVGGNRINGQNLGWSPHPVSGSASIPVLWGPNVAPAPGVTAGDQGALGLKSSSLLGTASPVAGLGTAILGADLTLTAPTTTRPDRYTATLTLTAI